jgi:hypothetical protein
MGIEVVNLCYRAATAEEIAKAKRTEQKTGLKERELSRPWRKTDESDRQSPTQL